VLAAVAELQALKANLELQTRLSEAFGRGRSQGVLARVLGPETA
jgi:hypothetical protein